MDKRDRDNSNLRVARKTTNDARAPSARVVNETKETYLDLSAARVGVNVLARKLAAADCIVCVLSGLTSKRVCGRVTSTLIHHRAKRMERARMRDRGEGGPM